MTNEAQRTELIAAASRLRMVSKNSRAYGEVYIVHSGDDDPEGTRQRAHRNDLALVSEFILNRMTGTPAGERR